MLALLATLLAAAPAVGAVEAVAEELAARATSDGEQATVALSVEAAGPLRGAVEAALAGALGRRGAAVLAVGPGNDAAGAARAAGADALLRVRASVERGALSLSGELVPVRPNFFLQRAPFHPAGDRLLATSTPADAAVRALAAAAPVAGPLALVQLAGLDEPVLALAVAPATAARPARIVTVSERRVALLDGRGRLLDAVPWPPAPPGPPPRDPAASVALGALGSELAACALAGRPGFAVLSIAGDRLTPAVGSPAGEAPTGATLPLGSGGAGTLYGAFAPGRGSLADLLSTRSDPAARLRSERMLTSVAAAPHPGRIAFAVLDDGGALTLLDQALAPLGPPLRGVGAGFALADLDGDGEPEVVVSSARSGGPDTLRVVRAAAGTPATAPAPQLALEVPGVEGSILAAAAGDVTGDGLDDAVLAAVQGDGTTRLWLLSADARGTAW